MHSMSIIIGDISGMSVISLNRHFVQRLCGLLLADGRFEHRSSSERDRKKNNLMSDGNGSLYQRDLDTI